MDYMFEQNEVLGDILNPLHVPIEKEPHHNSL